MKSFIRSYGAHALAYALSALTIVAGLPAPMQAVLGPHAGQIVGVAGILLTAAHNTDAVVNAPGGPSITTVAKSILFALFMPAILVAAAATGLTGCATVQGFFNSPSASPIIAVAVDVAVAAAEQKGISALKINTIAKQALAANSSTGATLATVSALVNVEIAKLNLPPLDMIAAQTLENLIAAEIQAKITDSTGAVNPNLAAAQTDVAAVLAEVIAATGG